MEGERRGFYRLRNDLSQAHFFFKMAFDYVFFQKKKQITEIVLEKMCDKIVDVVYENFSSREYFSKIS